MSPPLRLRRRRKKEDLDVRMGKKSEAESSCIYVVY